MCDVGHFSHTLHLCSLPRMDLWHVFPFRRPPRVSDSSESRVRVVLFDTLLDPPWRVSGNWSFTEYGYGACTEKSSEYDYIPEKILVEYRCGNPLGEACHRASAAHSRGGHVGSGEQVETTIVGEQARFSKFVLGCRPTWCWHQRETVRSNVRQQSAEQPTETTWAHAALEVHWSTSGSSFALQT